MFHVERDGEPVGLFVADHYARETKRGGAWMNSFVVQSGLLGTRPVVLNTLNLTKPAAGPTLLTVAEVVTLFHEFGHALHGLLSDVRYPTFAGTGVPRDFVEFPSQVNEVWLRDPEIVDRYARHHVTGAPLPDDLRARLIDPRPRSARASPPPSTSPLSCSTWPGTASRPASRWTTWRRSRRRHSPRRASPRRAAPALSQRLLQPRLRRRRTRPPTTPTSGARCSTPTPSSGSGSTAACGARTARGSPRRCCPAGARRPDGGLSRLPRPRSRDRPAPGRRGLAAPDRERMRPA